ncbi:ABC transporter ATP-binding protein [Parapedobacter indicus]|uniref:ATP-binding cassette, subfamily B n=1 Tax=Parapedobacter indicus TaxID=1477437 RepID=A0A1I3DJU6_9SPHI|nr:ABC transporter ATP-binding protein [Parapedobacter indicus]PPL04715.1 ATP-binding cassette subfamily B protein [Parapedobacter indicus]SFH86976.1 ATP-binding cassette, subfamily B [Parapedobacter indicus]
MRKPLRNRKKDSGIFSLLKPYTFLLTLLLLFAFFSNGLNLWIPKLIGNGIDAYRDHHFSYPTLITEFCIVVFIIFVCTYLQSILQTYVSEKVARDLRTQLAYKISGQSFAFIKEANPSKLLTNLTADVDSIKLFVAQAIVSIVSSLFIIIGASILLLTINWKLALAVIAIIPIIGVTFFLVLRKVRALFIQSRAVIDWLNRIINESILGAAIIRVINSQQLEYGKFLEANTKAKEFGLSILRLFAALIPIIIFTANMAGLAILMLGGHFVISGGMSLGDFAAFSSYLALLIFPILVIGFMSNVIAQATASYERINRVLTAPDVGEGGTITADLKGAIRLAAVSVNYGQQPVLKAISFEVKPGTKTAIIGPTAAGKTQLLYLLTGLIQPDTGVITLDGRPIQAYDADCFHQQLGFVFQDSIIFNMSIRENIAFSDSVTDDSLRKAVATAELENFINELPDKLDTVVSERGGSLSGGQKQRVMLARALALNPKILLLDDFTARVDHKTEQRILENIQHNYPDLTLISVTQKIASVENYDQLILLMDGEILAIGKHQELMQTSPEYIQISNSQKSTSHYEL